MPVCRGCLKYIVWVTTKNGKKIPCDNQLVGFVPMRDGKETFVTGDGSVYRGSRVIEGSGIKVQLRGRIAHWATCPAAEKFKPQERAPRPPEQPQTGLFEQGNYQQERGHEA